MEGRFTPEFLKNQLLIILKEKEEVEIEMGRIISERNDDRFNSLFGGGLPSLSMPIDVFNKLYEGNIASLIAIIQHTVRATIGFLKSVQEKTVNEGNEDREESPEMIKLQAKAFRLEVRVDKLDLIKP